MPRWHRRSYKADALLGNRNNLAKACAKARRPTRRLQTPSRAIVRQIQAGGEYRQCAERPWCVHRVRRRMAQQRGAQPAGAGMKKRHLYNRYTN
jgi:hypothetical protein